MIAEIVSGFLFLFIIIANIASNRFGYETFSDLNSEVKLQKIDSDRKKFKIGFWFILIEHISIIALAIMLFVAFNPINLILAIAWTVSRTAEGLIQIYYKKSYWGLLNIAKQYVSTVGTEKTKQANLALRILTKKNFVFTFAQVLFSIGTLAYSSLFVIYGVTPEIIGWFGIVAGCLYGLGSGVKLAKPNFKALWSIGGLLIFIFELILGGWLLFSPLF